MRGKMSGYIFRKANYEELEKCTELANLAFGFDFRTLLPKVYGESPVMQASHYVADNGELKGLVAVLEERQTVGETVLKTGYVGSVCVHPDSRGQSLMKKLMNLANNGMAANGTDIAFLNGRRQRYQYYGFVPAGVTYSFCVSEDNIIHALGNIVVENIRFAEITSRSELEEKAREMYYLKPVHFERQEFASLCCSYYQKPYAALEDGEFIGYVVTNSDKNCWVEVCVGDEKNFDLVVKAWMEQNKIRDLGIYLPEWECGLCRHLACYASGMSRGYSVQARIFRFKRVVEAYLKIKAHGVGISDGRMAFDIDDEQFEIIVNDSNVTVCEGGENPLRLTAYEANKLMLLPLEFEDAPKTPQGWFPLEICIAPNAPDAF